MKTKKSRIIEAYKKNLPKFKEILELSKELNTLTNERDILITKVVRLCSIILKNLSSKRKPFLNGKMFVSPAGITKRTPIYASNINLFRKEDFLKELIMLSKLNLKQELGNLISKEKLRIMSLFLKKAELLRIIEPFCLYLDKKKIYRFFLQDTEHPLKEIYVTKLYLLGRRMMIDLEEDREQHAVTFEFFSSENAIFVEQLHPEVKRLLKSAKKQKNKEITNIFRFIEFIKTKFGDTLAVEELQK